MKSPRPGAGLPAGSDSIAAAAPATRRRPTSGPTRLLASLRRQLHWWVALSGRQSDGYDAFSGRQFNRWLGLNGLTGQVRNLGLLWLAGHGHVPPPTASAASDKTSCDPCSPMPMGLPATMDTRLLTARTILLLGASQ